MVTPGKPIANSQSMNLSTCAMSKFHFYSTCLIVGKCFSLLSPPEASKIVDAFDRISSASKTIGNVMMVIWQRYSIQKSIALSRTANKNCAMPWRKTQNGKELSRPMIGFEGAGRNGKGSARLQLL